MIHESYALGFEIGTWKMPGLICAPSLIAFFPAALSPDISTPYFVDYSAGWFATIALTV
jgi:hypothetical protein